MRKSKRVARGFEIIKLEDSFEDDFDCLGSNPLNDASPTPTNSSSDDDWSVVDSDVDDGDVISSRPTSNEDETCVDVISKERLTHLEKDDLGVRADVITPVDDWISINTPSTPDLVTEEDPINVENFSAKNEFEESDNRSLMNERGKSDESDSINKFIFQNDLARELLVECVEFVGTERYEKENQDEGLFELICSDHQNLFPFIEISDSDSVNERKNSEAGEESFEKEMFFPYLEIPESEFTFEEVIPETGEGCKITHGDDAGSSDDHLMTEALPSDDHLMTEDESSDDFFDSLIDPEGYWCDPDTLLAIKCGEPHNFLPTNDLYDFFPARYCPMKFDRYGSRHRKRQRRVLDADKCWTKMYYYY